MRKSLFFYFSAILFIFRLNAVNSTTYFYLKDHLGSIRGTLNRETGELNSRKSYYPFGLEMPELSQHQSNAAASEKFIGNELDNEVVLYNFKARHYDPELGLFIQRDPFREFASPYLYVNNNPLIKIDPNGLYEIYVMANFSRPQTFPVSSYRRQIPEIKDAFNKLALAFNQYNYSVSAQIDPTVIDFESALNDDEVVAIFYIGHGASNNLPAIKFSGPTWYEARKNFRNSYDFYMYISACYQQPFEDEWSRIFKNLDLRGEGKQEFLVNLEELLDNIDTYMTNVKLSSYKMEYLTDPRYRSEGENYLINEKNALYKQYHSGLTDDERAEIAQRIRAINEAIQSNAQY